MSPDAQTVTTSTESRFLDIREVPQVNGGVTALFEVRTRAGGQLGVIRWFGPWRRYVYYPYDATLYDPSCLRAIGSFMDAVTLEHKAKAKTA